MKKRKTKITRNYLMHPAGSVLIETGETKVICTVMVEESIPFFLHRLSSYFYLLKKPLHPERQSPKYEKTTPVCGSKSVSFFRPIIKFFI